MCLHFNMFTKFNIFEIISKKKKKCLYITKISFEKLILVLKYTNILINIVG